jgi:hypothetical protein
MAGKNRQNLESLTDEELTNDLLDSFSVEILVKLLKLKIMAGQASVTDVTRDLLNEKDAAIVIMKKE